MFRIVKRMIAWCGKYQKRIYGGFLLSFLTGIFISLPTILAAMAIQAILGDMTGTEALTGKKIHLFFLMLLAAVGGRFLFTYLKARIQDTVIYEKLADERIRLGNILKRVPLGFFQQNQTGDLLTAMTTDMSFMEYHAMTMLDMVVNGYITSVVMLIFCMGVDWKLGAIMGAGLLASALFLHLMGKVSSKNGALLQKANEDMTGTTIEYLRGIALVKTFHQEGATAKGIRNAYRKSRDINVKIEKEYAVYHFFHVMSLRLASAAMVMYGGVMTWRGGMDLPTMVFVDIMSFMAFLSTENLSSAFHVLHVIDHTLDKLDRLTGARWIDRDGKDMEPSSHTIRFRDVSFGYDSRTVLKNVTCTFQENSFTAIVGPSGSGKTTMCNLIARFYDTTEGTITLGDDDLRSFTCDSILKQLSIVFQNVYLFHDTILENIRFGRPDASREEVAEAAKKARCHDFIMQLPDGYETMVGEGGSTLSGGEKQRISIARAILKDAPIIILDEATSSVDPENEHLIQEAIQELVRGKTVIAIAHRLPTIEQADQILVLDNGQIVQSGTHEELIQQQGTYRDFVRVREHTQRWSLGEETRP